MLATVKAFATFREILGRERRVELKDGATIADLLEVLALIVPRFKEAAFDDSGRLRDYVLLMKNQKRIDPVDDLSKPLQEGDEVAIFPPVAGG